MKPKPSAPFSNPGAEAALLGLYLTRMRHDDRLRAELLELDEDLFRKLEHVAVLRAMQTLAAAGDPVHIETVSDCLRKAGATLSNSLLLEDLADPDQAAPTPGPFVKILQECRARGRLDGILRSAVNTVADPTCDVATAFAEIRAALAATDATPGTSGRFRIAWDDELADTTDDWLVQDVLQPERFAVLFGPPEGGKSLAALDLALAMTTGQPWLGHFPVRQGSVFYLAAEGAGGFQQRIEAWKTHHDVAGRVGLPLTFDTVNLLQPADVSALLDAVASLPTRPQLVIVDTLARCLVGADENSAKDVGLAIAACERIRTTLNCTVLLVHHTAKHAETERGSSALRGAADTMIAVAHDGDLVTLSCSKQKDAAHFPDLVFRLVPVGDSVVLLPSDVTPAPARPTGSRMKALRALVDLCDDDDGVTFTRWHNAVPGDKSTFARAIKALREGKWIEKHGARYLPTASGRAAAVGGDRWQDGGSPPNATREDGGSQVAHPFRGATNATNPTTNPDDPEPPIAEAQPCVVCGLPSTAFSSNGDGWCLDCWEQRVGSA